MLYTRTYMIRCIYIYICTSKKCRYIYVFTLLINSQGEVKVTDFGVSAELQSSIGGS